MLKGLQGNSPTNQLLAIHVVDRSTWGFCWLFEL